MKILLCYSQKTFKKIQLCFFRLYRNLGEELHKPLSGGGGGTRTHTRFPVTGFLDRCTKPGYATPPNACDIFYAHPLTLGHPFSATGRPHFPYEKLSKMLSYLLADAAGFEPADPLWGSLP